MGEQVESGRVENVRDRQDVVEGAEYDEIGRGCDGSGGDDETNAPGRDEGPGGHLGEQVEMGAIEHDRKRQSDGDGSRIDGRRSQMYGAASGARYSSKRAGMRLLDGYQTSQHGRYECNTSDAPGPSAPPPPPRRRGRLKTRPKCQHHQMDLPSKPDVLSPIERIEQIGHDVYGPETVQERFQAAIPAKRDDGAAGVD